MYKHNQKQWKIAFCCVKRTDQLFFKLNYQKVA